jgi:hypothetical protein
MLVATVANRRRLSGVERLASAPPNGDEPVQLGPGPFSSAGGNWPGGIGWSCQGYQCF